MIETAHLLADAMPAVRDETPRLPLSRHGRRSAPKFLVCREEAEEPYRVARSRPGAPDASDRRAGASKGRVGASERRADPGPALRSEAPEGDSTPSTYPVERALVQADGLALSLRSALDRIAPLLACAAAAFVRTEAWSAFGFARLGDHACERFGRSGRWVRDLASLGDALSSLPGLGAALSGEDGSPPIGRVAALLISRVASPPSLAAWIAVARSVSVRELRLAVRQARDAGSAWPPGINNDDGEADESRAPAADSAGPNVSGEGPGEPGTPAHGHLDPDAPGDDPADRSLVRIPVPAPLVAAFDEGVDLFRAVEGTEASVTSFIEALVAESFAGGALTGGSPAGASLPEPPDDSASNPARPAGAASGPFFGDFDRVALRRGTDVARVEAALARSTGNWNHLPRSSPASWALHLAGAGLARLGDLSRSAGSGGPADLDAQIRELLILEDDLERRLGRLLAEMAERGAWPRLRFGGAGHYAEERLGLSRTFAEDRARVARSLRRFPLLRAAYEEGRVGLEATLTVLRILGDAPVDRATEAAWLARAEEATVKRLRDEARALGRRRFLDRDASADGRPEPAASPAAPPDSLASPSRRPDALPASPPRPLADAEWHAALRREPGTARERIIRFGTLAVAWPGAAAGRSGPDGSAGFARPDSAPLPGPDVFLRLRLPHDLADDLLSVIESTRRRLSDEAERVPWDEPWPDAHARPSILAARTFSTRSRRVPAWAGLLALLEDFVFTWDGEARAPTRERAARSRRAARQSCPNDEEARAEGAGPDRPPDGARSVPATPRRHGDAIYIRDGWRCSAPGCTSRRNLEDHHILYRARLGPDDLSNRVCLCRFHHSRGEHGVLASCRGTAPLGILWRLGKRELGTRYRNERRVNADAGARGGAG